MSREPVRLYRACDAAEVLGMSRALFFKLVSERVLPAADYLLPGQSTMRGKRWSAAVLADWQESRRIGGVHTLQAG